MEMVHLASSIWANEYWTIKEHESAVDRVPPPGSPALMAVAVSWEIRRADTAAAEGIARPAQALHQANPYTKAHIR